MDKKNSNESEWISSFLQRQKLTHYGEEDAVDVTSFRAQVEECQLAERIRNVVTDINKTAGYRILELLDFLSPQRTILTVTFSERRTEYVLEILVREGGPAVVFYSLSKFSDTREHFFQNRSQSDKPMIFLDQEIHPAEILSEDLRTWFSYLLSRFARKFKPKATQLLSETKTLESSAAFRKPCA